MNHAIVLENYYSSYESLRVCMPSSSYKLDGTTIKRIYRKTPSRRDFRRQFAEHRNHVMGLMKFRGNRPNYAVAGSI